MENEGHFKGETEGHFGEKVGSAFQEEKGGRRNFGTREDVRGFFAMDTGATCSMKK